MNNNELMHHGILGMKWGVRRYQNPDGTLTSAGKRRYNSIEAKYDKKIKYWQKGIDDFKPYTSTGMKSKNGKTLFTAKEINDQIKIFENRRKALKTKKDARLKDFDDGTKYLKQGQKRYDAIIKNYRDAKISEIKNSGYNKSPEYRRAVAAYTNQVISDMLYAQSGTKLTYAGESARNDTSYDKNK